MSERHRSSFKALMYSDLANAQRMATIAILEGYALELSKYIAGNLVRYNDDTRRGGGVIEVKGSEAYLNSSLAIICRGHVARKDGTYTRIVRAFRPDQIVEVTVYEKEKNKGPVFASTHERDLKAFVMYEYEKKKYKQIAEFMGGLSIARARQLVCRGRRINNIRIARWKVDRSHEQEHPELQNQPI